MTVATLEGQQSALVKALLEAQSQAQLKEVLGIVEGSEGGGSPAPIEIADIEGLENALSGKQPVGSYALTSDIAGVISALETKQPVGNYLTSAAFTWSGLAEKPTTFPPAPHTHPIADVTGLQTALDAKQPAGAYLMAPDLTWASISDKPATFAPSAHGHAIADVTGLQTVLDSKQPIGSYVTGGGTASGTNTGDQFTNMTASRILGRVTAGFGAAEQLTAAQVKTLLAIGTGDVAGLQAALDGKQAAGSYAAAAHSHIIGDVTGLQTALDGKQPSGAYLTVFGYSSGAGGAVTQATNKSTAVTLNKLTGEITMASAALAAGAVVTFVLNNNTAAVGDMIATSHHSGGTVGPYLINGRVTGAGVCSIAVRNTGAASLSEAVVIKFMVIKAANS